MKILRHVLLLLSLLAGGWQPATAQVFEWARLARNLGQRAGYSPAAATDPAGNTYTAIRFRDSLRVGGVRLVSPGAANVLVKYDSTGQVAWTKLIRGVLVDNNGLQVNPATGDLYLSGYLAAGATWDGAPLLGTAATYFYAKAAPGGALLWARARPYLLNPALAADDQGNCYLLGRAVGPAVGGIATDSTALVLAQANASGAVQWQRKLRGGRAPGPPGGLGLSMFYGLGARPGGGVLLFGQFQRSLYFGTAPAPVQTGPAQANNFVAGIDVGGTLQWSRPTPGLVNAATADAAGSYYVTGAFPVVAAPPATASNGIGVAKYSSSGTVAWTRTQQPDTLSFQAGRQIRVDGAGNVTIEASGSVALANTRLATRIGTLALRARSNVVHFDAQGREQWVANDWTAGPARRYNDYLEGVGLGLDARGTVYYTGQISGDSLRPRPAVQLGAYTLVGAGVVVSRIGTRHNTVAGQIYFDQNGNGRRDAGEGPFPVPLVVASAQATFPMLATPDAAGNYRMVAAPGPYSASVPQLPANYTVSQPANAAYAGAFSGYGGLDSARHFGIRPIANQADIRVQLTPYGAARPGFITRYRLTLENVGTTVTSGTATVALDGRMAYISSTASGSRTGQVVAWSYASLAPFGRREFDVLFSLPTNTPLGTPLSSTASGPLAADVAPADNTATAAQTVTGSFDPNDITVNYPRLTPAQVAAQMPLDYTVRFQNMGTDTAFTVVVADTLDFRKLNAASLQLVAQSHNCIWSLTNAGPNAGLLTVRFLNINLPHRNQDVIRSQGFVRFRVQPRATLAVGEVIPNHARIVFDYNAAIRTNTATTTVFVVTAALARHSAPAWEAYPNPATDLLNIAADLPTAGPVRLELFDLLGRAVRRQTLSAPAGPLRQVLDLSTLARGVYVLRLTPPTGPALSRQVARD